MTKRLKIFLLCTLATQSPYSYCSKANFEGKHDYFWVFSSFTFAPWVKVLWSKVARWTFGKAEQRTVITLPGTTDRDWPEK